MLRWPTVLLLLQFRLTSSHWIYSEVEESSLEEARKTGERARIEYLNRLNGVADSALRNEYYFDGLDHCNSIDRSWTTAVEKDAIQYGRKDDAAWLEKAGMKEFTALFMTFPPRVMVNVTRTACSKHEKQLECGSVYEGIDVTRERIEDLKEIGNHKIMFEKECKDPEWTAKVYPCIGRDVESWLGDCKKKVDEYSLLRDSVNSRIEQLYENSVQTIKNMKEQRGDAEEIFQRAMSSIVKLEGAKCALFKQTRLCVMRRLFSQCGTEAARAFNTSISLGYMRTERRERLSLDFKVFNYPSHPNCGGL